MLRVVIVDDEPKARKNLENILNEYTSGVEVIGDTGTISEAETLIKETRPDLVFLDVEMQNETGFDLFSKFDEIPFDVIFVTAHDQFAIKAFKYSAVDYLLKPINIDELISATEKVKASANVVSKEKRFDTMISKLDGKEFSTIVLPTLERMIFVKVNEIVRCESIDNYTHFHLIDKRIIMVSKNIKHYEEILNPEVFFRIHRSHIINLSEVREYIRGEGGYINMSDGSTVPVSRRKKIDFLNLFENFA